MIAMVKIKDYAVASTIVVPINTIQNSDEGSYVYIAEKTADKFTAKKQLVTPGTANGDFVEIKSGLQSGNLLITTGFQDLNTGQLVKF